MTDLVKMIAKDEELLAYLNEEYEDVRKKMADVKTRLNGNLIEFNKDNLESMKWLIANPMAPGAEDATNRWVAEMYGGTYRGPHPAGYTHNGDYVPIQMNVEFWLDISDDGKEECINNCKHFVENYLECFEALEDLSNTDYNVVGFKFLSTSNGLYSLGYKPETKTWIFFTTRYGTTHEDKSFVNFNEAIEFAYGLARYHREDYDE